MVILQIRMAGHLLTAARARGSLATCDGHVPASRTLHLEALPLLLSAGWRQSSLAIAAESYLP